MPIRTDVQSQAIVVRTRGHVCALPLGDTGEVMRPMPIDTLTGMPSFVLGLATIRGNAMPVIDLGKLLGDDAADVAPTRFVTLRADSRSVALAVECVEGVRALPGSSLDQLPPLLNAARTDFIDAIGVLDARLLLVLRAARLVPDEIWKSLESPEARA